MYIINIIRIFIVAIYGDRFWHNSDASFVMRFVNEIPSNKISIFNY